MFLQPLMLFGLAALAVPIIIHLLNRRRYEVVDWGAMRFLQMSKVTRRRLFLEEILLMVLRMALLALLVLAFARLVWGGDWLAWMEPRPNRDVVLIFDGSSSMNATGGDKTPQDAAKEWAAEYIKGLAPGDGVAVLQARQQVLEIVDKPSRDLQHYVPDSIRAMPRPGGACDLPAAVQAADALLAQSKRGERDVIVLSDGQAFGWSDGETQQRWRNLADHLHPDKPRGDAEPPPRLWVVNVDPHRDPNPPNWSLDPLTVNFPVIPIQCEVTFKTAIVMHGPTSYVPPPEGLELDVDGQFVRNVPAPPASGSDERRVQVTFTHRFAAEGTHLVTLTVKPDDKHDALADDNHTDYVVEVTPPMPILYVDGNPDPAQLKTGQQTLLGALALEKDTTPALQVTAVSVSEFKPELLVGGGANGVRPRVLVLCDVPGLTEAQAKAVEEFLADGGGVLATLGGRAEKHIEDYNRQLYQGGEGWLPAELTGVEGDETRPEDAAHVAVTDATHPVMERYRNQPFGGLAEARFPKWWKVGVTNAALPGSVGQALTGAWWKVARAGERAARLNSPAGEFPFLVERRYGAGRVLLCTVPLDNYWATNLTTLPDFVPLVHDLVYYLAGARSVEFNFPPGQPIRCRLASNAPPQGFRLQPPDGAEKPLSVGPPTPEAFAARETPAPHHTLVCDETRIAGVYRLTTPEGKTVYYVAQPDSGKPDPGRPGSSESDLKASASEDREKVKSIVPMRYENDRQTILTARKAPEQPDEWGPIFLVAMIALLCGEVWVTRRMVKNRS